MSTLPALDDIISQLATTLAELDDLIAEMTARRARVLTAIEALRDGEPVAAIPAPVPVKAAAAPKNRPAPKVAVEPTKRPRGPIKPCPFGCGFTHDWPTSMARHVAAKHPDGGAPPAPAPAPEPMTPAQFTEALKAPRARYMPDGKVLACTEKGCGFEAGSIHDLVSHTNTRHDREPLREERWPVLPAAAPVPT